MIRLVVILIGLALVYFFIKSVIGLTRGLKCSNCEGRGFWYATRGERVPCKVCNGSGFTKR